MPTLLLLLLFAADADTPRSAPPDKATVIMDVTDRPPNMVERNGVRWGEFLSRQASTVKCGVPKQKCQHHLIEVTNYSGSTLRCYGQIRYPQPNEHGIRDVERTIVVPVNKSWNLVSANVPIGMAATSHAVDCIPQPGPPPIGNPGECKLTILESVDVDAHFPAEARAADHEGPVFVEFTLASERGTPSDIVVYQTSTYPELDAAAVRMFADVDMRTNCPGKRYRTMALFKLKLK